MIVNHRWCTHTWRNGTSARSVQCHRDEHCYCSVLSKGLIMLLLTILCHTTLTTLLLYHAALCRAVPCRAADQLAIAIEDNAKA